MPTPELPVRHESFPASAARSAPIPSQRLRGGQIVLIDDDEGRDALQLGDGEHAVDEERLRHRHGAGGQHDQLVDIGNGGADEGILAGQKLLEHALARALPRDADEIAHQRRLVLPPKAAAGAALDDAVLGLHIIEAAQGFDDPVLLHVCLTRTK